MLELKPELVKTYLKLITEACVQKNDNTGTLRKDIWDYLYDKYENQVDYRDFLLAIRKFRLEGKMLNNEGIYTMASQVVAEIRAKTPTPVFTSKFAQDYKKQNGLINFLSGGRAANANKDIKDDQKISSKISNMGKQQKIKGRVFNMPRQTVTEVQERAKPKEAKEEARRAEEKVRAE